MNKVILLFIFVFSSFIVEATCNYRDLSDATKAQDRSKVYDNLDFPGVRFAWEGMKSMNSLYHSGTVDTVVRGFENDFCNKIQDKFKDVEIEIKKMDFKGYYITCNPAEKCSTKKIEATLRKMSPPVFPKVEGVRKQHAFKFTTAKASNYQEGYIKARIKGNYGDFNENKDLFSFIKGKLDQSLLEAFGVDDISQIDLEDQKIKKELSENIDLFRSGHEDKMDPKYKNLVVALDTLMEIPYQASNNFENELKRALGPQDEYGKPYSVAVAKSGDDMSLIVRKNKEIVKVVGVDAKGLGNLNMTTRLEQLVGHIQSQNSFSSMKDLLKVSEDAIKIADQQMDKSMDLYKSTVERTLATSHSRGHDLDQSLRYSHDLYQEQVNRNPMLMQMRAGAIDDVCSSDEKCLQDRITVMHNTLKQMEKDGIDGHFGDSCIGVEFWARFHGVINPLFRNN